MIGRLLLLFGVSQSKFSAVYVTIGSNEEAAELAGKVVEQRLAA